METLRYLNGRPQALFVLDFGLFKVHSNGRIIGICGFLVQTDAGENVLIDSGFPAKYASDTAAASAEDNLGTFGEVLSLTPGNLPVPQLARAGVKPQDITLMIQSHTHIDHVGGLHDFAQAPMLIAQAERDLPKPLYWGGAQPMDWPDRETVTVSGDCEIGPGFEVLFVPGHAPGQLAFLLDLPETGPVLLTSDAISRPAEIDEGFAGSWNEGLAQAHGERLMNLAAQKGAFVIYGHDPQQWDSLRKAPAHYG